MHRYTVIGKVQCGLDTCNTTADYKDFDTFSLRFFNLAGTDRLT
jgi:hypothetical protein